MRAAAQRQQQHSTTSSTAAHKPFQFHIGATIIISLTIQLILSTWVKAN
jgi:hypothetical protein